MKTARDDMVMIRSASIIRSTVLVSLLVAAFVGHRSARANELLRSIPPNTALDLGPYQCDEFPELVATEQTQGCHTITDYSGMIYDPVEHRMLVWGGGHAATYRDDVEAFDLETLEWYVDAPPTPCEQMVIENVDLSLSRWISSNHPIARHSYDLLVVVPAQASLWMLAQMQGRGRGCNHLPPVSEDAPYVLGSGYPARYDFETKQWTFHPEVRTWNFGTGTELDPVSGNILLAGGEGMTVLDPESVRIVARVDWPDSQLRRKIDTGEGVKLLYIPPRDSFYMVVAAPRTDEAGGVFEVIPDRSDWSRTTIRTIPTPLPDPPPNSQAWAFDESSGLIVGGITDGMIYAFEPENEQWFQQEALVDADDGTTIGSVAALALAYDPVDAVIIFRSDYHSGRRTWAYRWGEAPESFPDGGGFSDGSELPDEGDEGGFPDAGIQPENEEQDVESHEGDAAYVVGDEHGGHVKIVSPGCGCQSGEHTGLEDSFVLLVALAFVTIRIKRHARVVYKIIVRK